MAASIGGLMIFMGNGTLWSVAGNTAVPRGASTVIGTNVAGQPNPIPAPVSMAATPGGEFVLLATPAGNVYLHDPLVDDFAPRRSIGFPPHHSAPTPA